MLLCSGEIPHNGVYRKARNRYPKGDIQGGGVPSKVNSPERGDCYKKELGEANWGYPPTSRDVSIEMVLIFAGHQIHIQYRWYHKQHRQIDFDEEHT